MKTVKNFLAFVLTIATLIGMFSCATTVFAEGYNEYTANKAYQEKLLTETVDKENEQAEIVCEVPEKRDEFSKTYKRADGSFTSVISQTPLHSFENGEWKNIDNTLNKQDESIKNSDGAFNIEFPEKISENEKITITNGNDKISFSVNDIENADGIVEIPETDEKDIIKSDLNKTVSQITYEDIDENTNLQYIVSSNFIKENIIVSDKESLKDTYSFDIEKGELSANLDNKNNLIFTNDKNEIAFTIPAPVMTDAANAVSYDIEVKVQNGDKSVLTLTYTPSKEWLESKDRVYPVTIDPVLDFSASSGQIFEDTAIVDDATDSDSSTKNYADKYEGYISNNDQIKSEVLVKFNLEAFERLNKDNIVITDVNTYFSGVVNHSNIIAKEVIGEYDINTITYSDVYPTNDEDPVITYGDILDYFTGDATGYTDETITVVYFNITDIFMSWLSGEKNNDGFVIVSQDSSTDAALFLNGYAYNNTGVAVQHFSSYCTVDYVDTSCANDNYEYLTQEIGRAGIANVNTFSRGLSLSRSDLSMDGLRMPASIGFNYNSAFETIFDFYQTCMILGMEEEIEIKKSYGNGVLPSYLQWIFQPGENQYQFVTDEGTLVAFNEKKETDENDNTIITFEAEETSDIGYSLELIDQSNGTDFTNMRITTPSGEELRFNNGGFVTEIREAEANSDGSFDKIAIVYDENYTEDVIYDGNGDIEKIIVGNLFKIDYVTDGIGRKYDFIYNTETGLLSEIKCLTAEGEAIKAGTTDVDLKVTYGYDSNGNLTTVTYPDGEAVTYTYDTNGNLIKAQNIDNYNFDYIYDESGDKSEIQVIDNYSINYAYNTLGKVETITEVFSRRATEENEAYENKTTNGNIIQLSKLSNRQVKVVDGYNGTQTYQFGKDGRLHYTFDDKGNYYKSDYAPAKDENVYSSNDWKITSQNLLKNGSFEEESVFNTTRAKSWSTEFETTAMPTQQTETNGDIIGYDSASFGEKAYLISSTDDCTSFVTQTVEVANIASYTFSAFVRSAGEGTMQLKIKGVDASGNVDKEEKIAIASTTGWERFSVTYTPSDNVNLKEITVSIGFEGGNGSFYVDCAQLESSLGTAEYNLIENGSFNNNGEYWSDSTIETELINGKAVKAVKLLGGLPQYNAENVLEEHISATTQNVKINGKKGETYSIGGWFKGQFDDNYINENADTPYADLEEQLTNSSAQIKVTYSYTDTVTETAEDGTETTTDQTVTENFVVNFVAHNDGWQYAVDTFALKGDTESVDVTVMAKNVIGDSYATGIELTLDNGAFSFVEDEETTTSTENAEGSENTSTESTDTDNTTPTECPCEDCEELDCACRCESAEVCTCIQCKRQSDIEVTSEDGKTVTTSSFNGEKYMQSAVTYSNDMNNIIFETDENNISSGYAYNVNGSLIEFTDGAGNKTTYQSNAMGYLTLAESNVLGLTDNAVKMAISYVYDGDLLKKVTEGNVEYTYEYDPWGQLKKVLVDGETIINYNYGEGIYRTRILSVVFGSSEETGFTVKYTYKNGNIEAVEKYRKVSGEKDSITYNYAYDNLGNLDYIKDNGTGHFIYYTDDGIVIKASQNGSVIYETKDVEIPEDDTSKLVSITQETANGTSYNYKVYEGDYSVETGKTTEKEAVSVVLSQDESNNFTYGKTIGTQTLSDWFGRNEAVTVMTKDPLDTNTTDFASISSQYGYVTNDNITTNLISTVTNTITGEETNTVNYNYTYDSNGRITNASTVSSVANLSGASQYVYDEAGQLIKEITGSTIYEYAYDSKGNISSRKVYSGETLVSTDTFTYGSETWEDRLTGYNDKTVTYDSIGNPTSYFGATLSWRGRELAGYNKGNKQISYSYDVDGMRYQKIVKTDGVETARYDYVYSDGTLILLTYTENGASNTARFVYDSWGEPRGFMLNDSATYLYLKNAQGDIMGIVDENGEIVVRYTYNAWGAVDFVVPFGVDPSVTTILATVSPFTYRGYCYDYDIGMYYLQSRYYDPEICRFINADSTDYLGATGTLLSYNLFAYCENDPVNRVDEDGRSWKDVKNALKKIGEKVKKIYKKYSDLTSTKCAKILKSVNSTKNLMKKTKKNLDDCKDDILQHVKDVVNINYLENKGKKGYEPTHRKSYGIGKKKLYTHCCNERSTVWLYVLASFSYDISNTSWTYLPEDVKLELLNTFASWDKKTAVNIGLYYGVKVAKDVIFTAKEAGMNFIGQEEGL